jgi:hypothetical protein
MHFDDSKRDYGREDGDGVRSKVTRWGGSDPTLYGYPAAQTPLGVRGSLPPARLRFSTPSPALTQSGSEAGLK